jgi:hypothetical protein
MGLSWDGSPVVPATSPRPPVMPRATTGAAVAEARSMRHTELIRRIGELAEDAGEKYGTGPDTLILHYATDSRRIRTKPPYRAGFPDVVIVGPGGTIFAEAKCGDDTVSRDQRRWGARLTGAGQLWVVWEPLDALSGRIETELAALCVRHRYSTAAAAAEPGQAH